MKELTIEEKAKAYNKVREKIAIRFGSNVADEIFSEYEDNKDEKIRKALVRFHGSTIDIDGIKGSDIVAWLEKQDEQKPVIFRAKDWYISKVDGKIHNMMYNPADKKESKSIDNYCRENCKGFQETGKCFFDDKCEAYKTYMRKSADKVEHKFHEGEWITNGEYTWKIVEVKPLDYILQSQDGNIVDDTISHVDEQFHSFTIQDAKDGDVLAAEDKDKIFIYNGKLDLRGRVCAYCGIYKTHDGLRFTKCAIGNYFTYKEPYPATKVQRNTLFAKIREAGYEWDAEKKELKKMELTEHESEEELSDFEAALFSAFSDGWQQYLNGEEIDFAQWAKEHSTELLEAANQSHIAWSEEDETNLRRVEFACMKFFGGDTSLIGWLRKTLKRRLSS